MATDNVATIRRLIDQVWNKGSLEVLDELSASDVVGHDPMFGDHDGVENAKQLVQAFRSAFPDLRLTIEDIGAVDDKVIVRWEATGTHRGNLLGIAPTNLRCVVAGVTVHRFDQGKVAEVWYVWDRYTLLQQMALLPAVSNLARPQAQQPQYDPRGGQSGGQQRQSNVDMSEIESQNTSSQFAHGQQGGPQHAGTQDSEGQYGAGSSQFSPGQIGGGGQIKPTPSTAESGGQPRGSGQQPGGSPQQAGGQPQRTPGQQTGQPSKHHNGKHARQPRPGR